MVLINKHIKLSCHMASMSINDRSLIKRLSVKALAGPCRTEPTIVTEVGLRRMTIFGTSFYNPIKNEVIEVNYSD